MGLLRSLIWLVGGRGAGRGLGSLLRNRSLPQPLLFTIMPFFDILGPALSPLPVLHRLAGADTHMLSPSLSMLTVDFFKVLHELQVSLRDNLQVGHGQVDLSGHIHFSLDSRFGVDDFAEQTSLRVVLGKGQSGLTCVADLPAIPSHLLVRVPVVGSKLEDARFVNVNLHPLSLNPLADEFEIEFKDSHGRFISKGRIVQADVDSGSEGFIKIADSVGGQEQDPRVIFKHSQEHCFWSVFVQYITSTLRFLLPATKLFRLKSCGERSARKTSASSKRSTHPHLLAKEKWRSSAVSTCSAVTPRSPGIWCKLLPDNEG